MNRLTKRLDGLEREAAQRAGEGQRISAIVRTFVKPGFAHRADKNIGIVHFIGGARVTRSSFSDDQGFHSAVDAEAVRLERNPIQWSASF